MNYSKDIVNKDASDFIVALNNQGANLEAAAKTVKEALGAYKLIIDKYGEEHREPDVANRLKAAQIILEANKITMASPTGNNINIVSVKIDLEDRIRKIVTDENASFKTL